MFIINQKLHEMFNSVYSTLSTIINLPVAYSDAAEPWQLDLQEPACNIMEGVMNLHDDLMFF